MFRTKRVHNRFRKTILWRRCRNFLAFKLVYGEYLHEKVLSAELKKYRSRRQEKMRMKRKGLSGIVLIAGLAILLQGFMGLKETIAEVTLFQKVRQESFAMLGEIPKSTKPLRIGAVLITLANPYWVSMKEGYEHAALELGAQIDIQAAPQENSITAQLDILENMVVKGYDAIAAHTITAHNLIPGLVKATKRGVIIVTDKRVDLKAAREAGANPIVVGLVDYYNQGRMGGEYIAQQLGKSGGGKVAIIEGLPGAPQSEARRDGARDAFKSVPSISLVSTQPGNWDRLKAYNIATNLLQAHPDLRGIMCANDVMALAAVEAIEAAGKKDKVIVVGIDLISQAKEAILQGRLAGSVAQSGFIIAEVYARAAIAAALGKKIPEGLSVPSALVTKANIHLLQDWR
jgi:D-allose transport system substrate-binding protein